MINWPWLEKKFLYDLSICKWFHGNSFIVCFQWLALRAENTPWKLEQRWSITKQICGAILTTKIDLELATSTLLFLEWNYLFKVYSIGTLQKAKKLTNITSSTEVWHLILKTTSRIVHSIWCINSLCVLDCAVQHFTCIYDSQGYSWKKKNQGTCVEIREKH